MDIRQLRYFLAVAEAGTLTQAARSLFITQPALTVALKKLETDLHTQLFQRGADSRYELTRAGRLLYDEGSDIVARMQALEDRIRDAGAESRESIRVGLTVLFAMQFMSRISTFIATHRNVEVTLVQGGSRELQHALAAGELDVGLLSFPVIERDVSIELLPSGAGSYSVAVVMPADNPLASRESVTFADLREQRFCTLSDNFVLGNILAARCAQAGFEPDVAMVNDNWEVLLTAVPNLDAVCLLPAEFRQLSPVDGLAWVPLQDKANFFPIGIATHKTRERSTAVDEFVFAIRDA